MTQEPFHHIVLFRVREGITLERVRRAREALAALVETLPGVRDFTVTENVAKQHDGYKLALISSFEDKRAYDIFARHPESIAVLDEFMNEVAEDHLVIQGSGT